jgi:hypothetical protein
VAASSAPVVKANLLTILRARAGLSGVNVFWANPGTAIGQECIWLGKVSDLESDDYLRPAPRRKQEDYTVEVIVWCVMDGDDPQTVETRWWALVGEVESALQADPTVGGAVNQWATITGMEQSPFTDGGQRGSEGVLTLTCHHRK